MRQKALDEPRALWLCEAHQIILRPDKPYVFRVDEDCVKCLEYARLYDEWQGNGKESDPDR